MDIQPKVSENTTQPLKVVVYVHGGAPKAFFDQIRGQRCVSTIHGSGCSGSSLEALGAECGAADKKERLDGMRYRFNGTAGLREIGKYRPTYRSPLWMPMASNLLGQGRR